MKKLVMVVAVVVTGVVHAEDLETIGLWTFDGENGAKISESREEVVFPNKIDNEEGLALKVLYASGDTKSPIPLYTDDIQHAYVHGDAYCTNVIATCGTALYTKSSASDKVAAGKDFTWGAYRPNLHLTGAGVALAGQSFTLEVVYKSFAPSASPQPPVLYFGPNTAGRSCVSLTTNGKAGSISRYYNTTSSSAIRTGYSTPYQSSTPGYGLEDGQWHHFAVRWNEETKTMSLCNDYYQFEFQAWTDENLCLSNSASFKLFPNNNSAFSFHTTVIQAVRLTRGLRTTAQFMQVTDFTPETRPDTVVRYRYDGEPGTAFQTVCNEALARADLEMWSTKQYYVEPWKACVKDGSEISENLGCIGNTNLAEKAAMSFASITGNPYLLRYGDSFTHEFFMSFHTNRTTHLTSGRALVIGEGGGVGKSTDGYNWMLAQVDSGSDADRTAHLYLQYRGMIGGTATGFSFSKNVTLGDWHHIAIAYDSPSRTLNFYIDRKAVHTKTFAEGDFLTRGTSILMRPSAGAAFNYNSGIDGRLDEYRLSRRALAPDEFLKAVTGEGLTILLR